MKGKFFKSTEGVVECSLCPHRCRLKEGQTGLCRIRGNRHGQGTLLYYGCITAEAIDSMEKKPLYHFLPGEEVYSIGFAGCNLQCPFCQNSSISQSIPSFYKQMSPEELIEKVLVSGAPALAFTYSEPLVHYEFIYNAARLAKAKGIKTVLVTNGMINKEPARKLLPHIDALNIDLKSFSRSIYSQVLKGNLDAVKDFIAISSSLCYVEVTTLVVPGLNDSIEEISEIADFLNSVDPDIVYHISAYYPSYKYHEDAVSSSRIAELAEIAREKIMTVYQGNTGADNSLYCNSCGEILIRRKSYTIEDLTSPKGQCRSCGKRIKIIY